MIGYTMVFSQSALWAQTTQFIMPNKYCLPEHELALLLMVQFGALPVGVKYCELTRTLFEQFKRSHRGDHDTLLGLSNWVQTSIEHLPGWFNIISLKSRGHYVDSTSLPSGMSHKSIPSLQIKAT